MAKTHEYGASVEWTGGRGGSGKVTANTSGVTVNLAVPPEFGGEGNGTNPEETLTNALAACYTIIYGIVAEAQRVPVKSVHTEATGEVEEDGINFTFSKVTLRPTITLESAADDDVKQKAEQLAHRADAYCIVTKAVKGNVEVVIEPKIVVD